MSDDAIPAATLIVVRERASGPPELLMVERAQDMAFAGGAWVFPGGRIDKADERFAASSGSDAARVAAIREGIEETAIPVAVSPTPDAIVTGEMQRRLLEESDFEALLEDHGLTLDPDALTPLARWVPRFHATRRFDTIFFVARAPAGEWVPNTIERECAGAHWIGAAEALRRDEAGELQLIFPTRRTLERLAQHDSFEAIVADAREHPIEPISPWLDEVDGERFITIPEGIGYPITRERLEGLWRG